MNIFLQGLTMGLAYVAPIGMQNLFVINSALTNKRKRALLTALIVIFFDITLSLACFFGIGTIMQKFKWLQMVILCVGSLIVIYIGISLLLFTMSFVDSTALFTVLWLITGFGGGVVYTISARAKKLGCYDKSSMTISENIGHTLGLAVAVISAAVFGMRSPDIMLVASSVSALLAVVSMTFTPKGGRSNENIDNNG